MIRISDYNMDGRTLLVIVMVILILALIPLSLYFKSDVNDLISSKKKKIKQLKLQKVKEEQAAQEEAILHDEELFKVIKGEADEMMEDHLIKEEEEAINIAEIPETTDEVFAIGKNVYRYMEAADICRELGTRLATKEELDEAYENGADWCNLGWVQGIEAYYPRQTFDVKRRCGGKGMNGGKVPSQVKLGAVCYGLKPPKGVMKELQIQPWNSKKWSRHDR